MYGIYAIRVQSGMDKTKLEFSAPYIRTCDRDKSTTSATKKIM